jgi:hypothetical protein
MGPQDVNTNLVVIFKYLEGWALWIACRLSPPLLLKTAMTFERKGLTNQAIGQQSEQHPVPILLRHNRFRYCDVIWYHKVLSFAPHVCARAFFCFVDCYFVVWTRNLLRFLIFCMRVELKDLRDKKWYLSKITCM